MFKKKKTLIFWVLAGFACIIATGLVILATYVIISRTKLNYPDYVSAWRQDSQTMNPSFPTDMEFFHNGICTADGIKTKYKFDHNSVQIGDITFSVTYDANRLTLSSASDHVSYESVGSSERYDYRIENGGAVIQYYYGEPQTLIVPDTLGGVPVTKIASLRSYSLVHLVLPNSVTAIGSRAFWFNSSMEEIVLSQSLTEITDRAFENCSALANIVIPQGVTSIGEYAFSECTALESVELPKSLDAIGAGVFYDCTSLKNVAWSSGLIKIGDSAFRSCKALNAIDLPSGIVSIADHAFSDCTSLRVVSLPASLTALGMSAFSNCTSLVDVALSRGISKMSGFTFQNCSSLKSVTIPYGVTTLWLEEFSGCTALTTVHIPETIVSISNDAFIDCPNLSDLAIAVNNPTYASQNNALVSADGKTFYYYFDGSRNTCYTIPAGVETIATDAFLNCTHLKQVIIPEGVSSIECNAFNCCLALESLSFPASAVDCSYAVTACCSLNDVTISPLNPKYSVRNGLLLNENGLYLYNCFYGAKDGVLVLPEGIAHIFGNPYENIADLQSVWLPKSLIDIGLERGNSALGSESYLKQNNITVYAWSGSDAYKAAKKYDIPVIQRMD